MLWYYLEVFPSAFVMYRMPSLGVRAIGAGLTACILCLCLGSSFIQWVQRLQFRQFIRELGPHSHLSKQGTPTLGGVLILLCFSVSVALWADWRQACVPHVCLTALGFGFLGFLDDIKKILGKKNLGLRSLQKFLLQCLLASMSVAPLIQEQMFLTLPFWKDFWYLGPMIGFVFFILVMVGTSNAVNLTDGLDGLVIGPVLSSCGILIYLASHTDLGASLHEIIVISSALAAACLGFLWFNSNPAQIFMGDTGSLSIGATIAIMALLLRCELLLLVFGSVFVAEALSVMLQVVSFKSTGKRIFKMAPLHHHYELKGYQEQKVVIRFWIVAILSAILTLGLVISL